MLYNIHFDYLLQMLSLIWYCWKTVRNIKKKILKIYCTEFRLSDDQNHTIYHLTGNFKLYNSSLLTFCSKIYPSCDIFKKLVFGRHTPLPPQKKSGLHFLPLTTFHILIYTIWSRRCCVPNFIAWSQNAGLFRLYTRPSVENLLCVPDYSCKHQLPMNFLSLLFFLNFFFYVFLYTLFCIKITELLKLNKNLFGVSIFFVHTQTTKYQYVYGIPYISILIPYIFFNNFRISINNNKKNNECTTVQVKYLHK